ncbi:hypothetical protein OQH60_03985 [Campylobacter sp. MIT 21-1685]|uniref:hypothetical protein n=1 Tax=unclassified Campylobacter TaxID=2593542 RepID=UPI00224B17B1|nr:MULTISPECIES: hypothetical protein [unclassified Campylobacter]MCX2683021.1 hypothetical protein [Campylobacter sp. MIT 21-1684]MCX2751303.1 hypothetical protein [Campylobacter sp. MIT 21-1682]MCX2807502.1 hypothetical protein [Campylobacter sp. MIT 21-1685]
MSKCVKNVNKIVKICNIYNQDCSVCEIQRVFLLQDSCLLEDLLNKNGLLFKESRFEIFYTHISLNKNIQFQNIHKSFYKITFLKNEIQQKQRISKREFKKARKKALVRSLHKKIYELQLYSFQACIEFYKELRISVLKVFFHTLEERHNFVFPKDFGIEKEITEKENLNSKSLILYGYEGRFNIEKCLKIIDSNVNFTLNFPDSLYTFDGLRIFLFYLFKKLQFWHKLSLETRQRKHCYQFFLYAQKIFIVFFSFDSVFDKNLSKNLSGRFKILSESSLQILNSRNFDEKLLLLLTGERVYNLFGDFDFFIKENSFYQNKPKEKFFKQLVALELRRKLVVFKRLFYKNDEYEMLERKFIELKVFLEYFCCLFRCKSLEKLAQKYFSYTQTNVFLLFSMKKQKFFKLIDKSNLNLKMYKG